MLDDNNLNGQSRETFGNFFVVIPSFNEGEHLIHTINKVKMYFKNIIVVDDGSSENWSGSEALNEIHYLRHPINLGQGAALQTGIKFALNFKFADFIITFDADGQHSLDSALEMCEVIKKTDVDIVLGSRFINNLSEVPQKRKLILKLGIIFTRLNTGMKLTDTHNGLRVMNRKFANSLEIKQLGMAHASEILLHIKKTNSKWLEYPAEIFYSEYSQKKGQSTWNAINILTELMHKW